MLIFFLIFISTPGDAPQLAGVPGRNTAPVPTLVEPMAIKLPLPRWRHHQTVSAGSLAMAVRATAPALRHVTACVIMEGLHVTAGVHALLGTKALAAKHVRYCSILWRVIIVSLKATYLANLNIYLPDIITDGASEHRCYWMSCSVTAMI